MDSFFSIFPLFWEWKHNNAIAKVENRMLRHFDQMKHNLIQT